MAIKKIKTSALKATNASMSGDIIKDIINVYINFYSWKNIFIHIAVIAFKGLETKLECRICDATKKTRCNLFDTM